MLLEAAVVQWYWLEEKFRGADQFNSIHERLIEQWKKLKWSLRHSPLYFTYAEGSLEDLATVTYLMDTAAQAGLETAEIVVSDIGWQRDRRQFVDLADKPIQSIFKLYPWEWLMAEEFGPQLLETYREMQWLEPIWKLVLSTKGILPILWELNPGHPNLLAAWTAAPPTGDWVKKPRFSREGANVAVQRPAAGASKLPAPTVRKASFINNWRRCPTSTAIIRCSAVGSSAGRPPAWASGSPPPWSPTTGAVSSRIYSLEKKGLGHGNSGVPFRTALHRGRLPALCGGQAGL